MLNHIKPFKQNFFFESTMNKWFELTAGLILIVATILVWAYSPSWGEFWNFGSAAWTVFKGGLVWFVLGIGTILVLLGITELKEE